MAMRMRAMSVRKALDQPKIKKALEQFDWRSPRETVEYQSAIKELEKIIPHRMNRGFTIKELLERYMKEAL
ncbi:hypothetical protein UFOVP75_168 [uncultured Caudovirales phage]|uniref:Uncharacterized protein n=1 Tax=uncultured Caudovirales phage TaxID=2100421 RepID=A0A6J5KZ88_9CAUD|nr:hypothetical protein UFOVP75_168 [uncultured Caudovirales phage]